MNWETATCLSCTLPDNACEVPGSGCPFVGTPIRTARPQSIAVQLRQATRNNQNCRDYYRRNREQILAVKAAKYELTRTRSRGGKPSPAEAGNTNEQETLCSDFG